MITKPSDLMETYPPVDDREHWTVVGDLRIDDDHNNYEYSEPVMVAVKAEGLDVDADPEFSASYFYCRTEAAARRVVEIIDAVVTPLWDGA
jgi:hypothetical protein